MGHGQQPHYHGHLPAGGTELPSALDPDVPDNELAPGDLSRRDLLRRAGLFGVGLAGGGAVGVLAGAGPARAGRLGAGLDGLGPETAETGDYLWLAGDHHIHTLYSPDGMYRVEDQVKHAAAYGLDWLVITDHGGPQHLRVGVEKTNPDIRRARAAYQETLVFQGLEWNIPSAEHGTVIVHPGPAEVAVLKEFEAGFDGVVRNAAAPTPENEALAIAGINFLADAVALNRVPDALFLANHPARRGLNTPHEMRNWRDAQPTIAVGMEGAPGHQPGGIKAPFGPGAARGLYDSAPSPASFPAYPLESYRTFGGFDWMTSTVGGLWDSMLAEGKPWGITANSDSHFVHADSAARDPASDFLGNGFYNDPVYGVPANLQYFDFWPGYYSRTHVGARRDSYAAVMEGLRAGRVWVDHGGLISEIHVQVRQVGAVDGVTLGGTLVVPTGTRVELAVTIELANRSNWAQFVPTLARVDVIAGDVTGPAADRDVFTTPATRVVKSYEVNRSTGRISFVYPLGPADRRRYLRLRGTDGKRTAPGLLGAQIDPAGPAMDVVGDADPWQDLWFYTNPVWVLPRP